MIFFFFVFALLQVATTVEREKRAINVLFLSLEYYIYIFFTRPKMSFLCIASHRNSVEYLSIHFFFFYLSEQIHINEKKNTGEKTKKKQVL